MGYVATMEQPEQKREAERLREHLRRINAKLINITQEFNETISVLRQGRQSVERKMFQVLIADRRVPDAER